MALVFNEEQRMLQDTARHFFNTNAPVALLRTLRDESNPLGYSQSLWEKMVTLGWPGIILPEQYSGVNFGFLGLGAILEQSGHTLVSSPLFSTIVLGASTLLLNGSDQQKQQLLPAMAAGDITLALALEESHHHNPTHIELHGISSSGGFVLNGSKYFVLDGHSADVIIVATRTSGNINDHQGITLMLVDTNAPGVHCTRTMMVDSRNAATIHFDNVFVQSNDVIGNIDQGWCTLESVLDRGRICLAAEMLGTAQACFDHTIAYLKEREQFGVKIGSFQVLKHRAAIMHIELELSRSVIMDALSAIDEARTDIPQLASLAKARLNDTCKRITNEAIQMHGGIGITDELDIGFFLKRAGVTMQIFGDTGFHQDRYAALCGY